MDLNHLIAFGVLAQLTLAAIRHFVHSPQQQAQLDTIQGQLNAVVTTLAAKGNGKPL